MSFTTRRSRPPETTILSLSSPTPMARRLLLRVHEGGKSRARSSMSLPRSNLAGRGRVVPARIGERGFVHALAQAHDGSENDDVRVALDRLLHDAVESGQRIGENGRPCGQRDPLSAFEPARTMHAAASAEAVRQ